MAVNLQGMRPVRESARVEIDGTQLLGIVELGDFDPVHLERPVRDRGGPALETRPVKGTIPLSGAAMSGCTLTICT